ncbi:hypothetical protein EON65_37930 [archaeon]|nr:MAG: hypothetical protein EON65_37930 [archaeon]
MRAKIERDVMAVSTEVMDKNITKMQEQNDINEIKLRILQKRVQSLKDEVTSLSAALESKQELDKQCRQIQRSINEQTQVMEQWHKVTMKICRRILKECLEIANKQRIRDNSRLTQQLDELTANAPQADDASKGSRSRHSSCHEDDELSQLSSQYDSMDFEAIWKCPAQNTLRHFYSTGKLVTTNDWRRMKTIQSGEMNRNQSDSMLVVSSQAYKSFSM